MRLCVAALCLACLTATVADAQLLTGRAAARAKRLAASEPIPMSVWNLDTQTPVEQQTPGGSFAIALDPTLPYVINPGPVFHTGTQWPQKPIWDADDRRQWIRSEGPLAAGQSIEATHWIWQDNSSHAVGIRASSSDRRGEITISITYRDAASGAVMFQRIKSHALPIDANDLRSRMVAFANYNTSPLSDNPNLMLVPDSGVNGHPGGYARLWQVTVRVTNTGGRKLQKVGAAAAIRALIGNQATATSPATGWLQYSPTGLRPTQSLWLGGHTPRWVWED